MAERKELLMKDFYKIVDQLKQTIGSYNFFSKFVCLLFLQYIISYSDTLPFASLESYKGIISFKRKFDAAKHGEPLDENDFYEVLRCIDQEPIFRDLQLANYVKQYADIFRNVKTQSVVIYLLEELDFFAYSDQIGMLFEIVLKRCLTDVQNTMVSISNPSLRELAEGFLKVSNKDIYLDCYSGYSSTLFDIDSYDKYIGYEINFETALISKMMLIMMGKKNFEIRVKDFFKEDTHEIANKVFSDGPISVRTDYFELYDKFKVQTRDNDVLSLYKVFDSIKPGGIAAITVPGKVLFSNTKGYRDLRRYFSENGLKAVISLPPLWAGISINTNLLIIEKGYKGHIEFIEAKDLGKGDRKSVIINSEDIEKIIEHVTVGLSETSFSAAVDPHDVINEDSWLPSKYIAFKVDSSYREVSEIDEELENLYTELKNNL